jgi:uncharacterized protein
MADQVIHFEVVGRDQAKLQQFYRDLFGWTIDSNNPGGYGFVSKDEAGIAIGVGATPDGSAGHVTGYIAVKDIDAKLADVERLGGRTVMPKMSPGPDATIALFADPEGHVIGLTEV